MDLEQFTKQVPAPILATGVILLGIGLFFILQPPHTICDTQRESLKENQRGILFPIKRGKTTTAGRIQRALEVCRFGNSSGACFEYFDILRRASVAVKNVSQECYGSMMGIPIEKYIRTEQYHEAGEGKDGQEELLGVEYKNSTLEQVLKDGLETMIRKAWGEAPPEPGPQRYGWFQETELNAYCHVQDVLIRAKGRAALNEIARAIYPQLPGQVATSTSGSGGPPVVLRKATEVFTEEQIRERSLLSVPCSSFR
jgi:hypothetical protein